MSHPIRAFLTLTLTLLTLLPSAGALRAQEVAGDTEAAAEAPPEAGEAAEPAGDATTEAPAPNVYQVRNQLSALLRQQPPELAAVLALDPTLLSNEAFLAGYPQVATFLEEHPEVRHNPSFYLGEFRHHRDHGVLSDVLEAIIIFATFGLIALALAWLVRTVIEQKRWSRLSRTQTEVHNKILDRFGTSEELLEYVRTPAGGKFLTSAPIPLHADRATQSPPVTRILWSIQIGVVVGAAALGTLLVGFWFGDETARDLFALGVIGVSVGAGFIGSAAVSLFLSRRLGLWELPGDSATPPPDRADEPGLVR